MATVFESLVGNWGEIFIKVGVVISVMGAYLAWTLIGRLWLPRRCTVFDGSPVPPAAPPRGCGGAWNG